MTSVIRHVSLALALVLATCASGYAERPPLKSYTTADGLPHDSINKIVRDSHGFLWFCTADGLSRFDGFRFKSYTQDQGLPHRNVNDLLETREGTYVVATSSGLAVFNPLGVPYRWNVRESRLDQTAADAPLFRTFLPASGLTRRSRTVLALAEDTGGRVWAATARGLFRLEHSGDSWTFAEFDTHVRVPETEYQSLLADDSGGVLVGSTAGVLHITADGTTRLLLPDPVGAIYRDRAGRLWMDVSLTLKVFAFEHGVLRELKTFTQRDGLPAVSGHFTVQEMSDGRLYTGFEYGFAEVRLDAPAGEPAIRIFEREKINTMAEDGAGALWIGTDTRGAWKMPRAGFTTFGPSDGVSPQDEVMSVSSGHDGSLYLVLRPNKVARLTDRGFETVTPHGLNARSWGWHFLDLRGRNGDWWVPSVDGLRHYPRIDRFADLARTPPARVYTTADGLFLNEIFEQFEDSRGDLWFTMSDRTGHWDRETGAIRQYDAKDGLPAGSGAISYAEDPQGAVWVGFYFGGVARFRNGTVRFFSPGAGLPRSQVSDLLVDASGTLWIGTSAGGLFVVDDTRAETPTFRGLSTADGLPSNQVSCLTQDRAGRVYAGTGRGLTRIDRDGGMRTFTVDDGLPGNNVSLCASDAGGALWVVSRNTLLRLQPGVDPAPTPPPVLIDRVLVNGAPQKISELGETAAQPLDLGPDQHQIEVSYFALAAVAGENVRYQYRFDDDAWSAPIRERSLNFDLSPGRRTLAIRAVDSRGLTSPQPATVAIRILSPLWLRPWFIAALSSAVAALLFGLYSYRMNRLREVNAALAEARRAEEALGRAREDRLGELERVRRRIATDLHDDIGSSLTQIAMLSEVAHRHADGSAADARQPIERVISISNELVDTMSDIVWAINPRKDHLSDLLQRMRRFASDVLAARGIAVRFQAPDSAHDLALGANVRREVFLIFKETIMNVARHADCTEVEIAFGLDGDALVMQVRDNGRGFDVETAQADSPGPGGNGLPNLRRRAGEMNGAFEVTARPGEGTTVRLAIPMAQPADRG